MRDGRRFEPELPVRARRREDGVIELLAPCPGLWRGGPEDGALVKAGSDLGELEVLGVLHRLRAPSGAFGLVERDEGPRLARMPVDAETVFLRLRPEAALDEQALPLDSTARESTSGPVFRTPLGGRYYAKPGPTAEPFVKVGDEITTGTTVALIEVMKTFNRVNYGGAGLPARARAEVRPPRCRRRRWGGSR